VGGEGRGPTLSLSVGTSPGVNVQVNVNNAIDAANRVMQRICPSFSAVVAIDPSASSHEGSDECGIVSAALGSDDDYYILDDVSGVMSPNKWGREAIFALPCAPG
jgi:phage terminase large subunit-like protein